MQHHGKGVIWRLQDVKSWRLEHSQSHVIRVVLSYVWRVVHFRGFARARVCMYLCVCVCVCVCVLGVCVSSCVCASLSVSFSIRVRFSQRSFRVKVGFRTEKMGLQRGLLNVRV